MKIKCAGRGLFVIPIVTASLIALVISKLSGLSFWAAFAMAAVAMLLNGLLATWEDNQPGGFNNPLPPEKNSPPDHADK